MITRWTLYFTILLVVANGLDILSTYHVSPDLQREANVVVISMGRTWSSVFIIKGLGALTAIMFFYFGLHTLDRRARHLEGKKSICDVYSFLLYKERVPMIKLLIGGKPKDWGAATAVTGVFLAAACLFGGLLGAIGNTFGLVRSVTHLLLLYSICTAIGVTCTGYLLYLFLLKSIKAEPIAPLGPRKT